MFGIAQSDIRRRLALDNPWWDDADAHITRQDAYPKRAHFNHFCSLVLDTDVRRALVLMGPRRIGKTFLIKQFVAQALRHGYSPKDVLYVTVDAPIYSGISLAYFVDLIDNGDVNTNKIVIFDEIQYFKDWEIHLKDLVDSRGHIKFVASGSAAAALRLKSKESGAGRFTDFYLPPLSFSEYIDFIKKSEYYFESFYNLSNKSNQDHVLHLNKDFIDYINFGGYPELIFTNEVKNDMERYVRSDIVDKVLLKDLPNLYGINDIQELNRLFSMLAYNDGREISLEALSRDAQVSKPTIRKYIEYLESAYLVSVIDKIDINARRFLRQTQQKIYLTNPCMRAALFGPVNADDRTRIGNLAEAACFAQLDHARWPGTFHYARTPQGEIDMVLLSNSAQKPTWIAEIKWSDRYSSSNRIKEECSELISFCKKHSLSRAFITTETISQIIEIDGIQFELVPTSIFCYKIANSSTSRALKAIDL